MTGFIRTSPVTDALRVRDQLYGYQDNLDEPVIPIIVDSEPRLNGYYRVTGVTIGIASETFGGVAIPYVIRLVAVSGFAQPMMESVINGALLTNVVGAVVGDAKIFHSVPNAAVEYWRGATIAVVARASADGVMLFYQGGTFGQSANFYLLPSTFYVGAATFEQGSPLRPVVGRQQILSDVVNWRLSNGLVRVTPNAVAGKIDVAHWSGSAWITPKTYQFSGTTAGLINNLTTVTVLRNSTEETIIRLGCTVVYGLGWGRVNLDISLRRGDLLARLYLRSDGQDAWKVARSTIEAGTAIAFGAVTTGGLQATVNDAGGNQYALMSYQAAVTMDTVNGALTQSAATNVAMDIGLGLAVGGSGAPSPNRAIDLGGQYVTAMSETQRVVAR